MVSGVDKEELLYLEINFLKLIGYQLVVDPVTFQNYYNHLVETCNRKAVLSNCSCLDPAHSYKILSSMMKQNKTVTKAGSESTNSVRYEDQ